MERTIRAETEAGGAGLGLITKIAVLVTAVALVPKMFMGGDGVDKPSAAALVPETSVPAGLALSPPDEIVIPPSTATTLSPETTPPETAAPEAPPTTAAAARTSPTTRHRTTTTKPQPTTKPTTATTTPAAPVITAAPITTTSTAAPTTTTTTRPPTPEELAFAQAAALFPAVRDGAHPIKTNDSCRILNLTVTGSNPGMYTLADPILFDVGPGPDILGGWVDNDNAPNRDQPIIVGYNATITGDIRGTVNEGNLYCGIQKRILYYDSANTRLEGVIPEGPDQPAERKYVGVAVKHG